MIPYLLTFVLTLFSSGKFILGLLILLWSDDINYKWHINRQGINNDHITGFLAVLLVVFQFVTTFIGGSIRELCASCKRYWLILCMGTFVYILRLADCLGSTEYLVLRTIIELVIPFKIVLAKIFKAFNRKNRSTNELQVVFRTSEVKTRSILVTQKTVISTIVY